MQLKCKDIDVIAYDLNPELCIPKNTTLTDMLDCEINNQFKKINYINIQKKQSIHIDASFNIGLIIIKNINNIHEIEKIKVQEKLHYIVVVRQKQHNIFLENLVEKYQLIDIHLIEEILYNDIIVNYKESILHDYFIIIN